MEGQGMRRRRYRPGTAVVRVTGLLLVLGLWGGCVSLMEKAGRVLDGSAFAEKTLAVYRTPKGAAESMEIRELRDKAGERSFSVSTGRFPAVQLRGSVPDAGGNFFLTSLEYLGSSVSGWNEYRMEISGAGTLILDENTAVLTVPEAPEGVQIVRGRIHRYDTRLTGDEALTSLRNRQERIEVLAEWMKNQPDAPRFSTRKDFEKYWKPVLLPEMVHTLDRPALWKREGDQWARAEDIRWNISYTERTLPEELWAVRNSGTLLRDWEEAPGWIYLEYEWETFTGLLSRENTLQRIR